MKILVTIPHFFGHDGRGNYGSTASPAVRRANALRQSLLGLFTSFSGRHRLADSRTSSSHIANERLTAEIDIVVCTSGRHHLVDQLGRLPFRHESTDCQPRLLGYECHRVLKENLGRYDFYSFMEDDLLINDMMFFTKLKWFTAKLGDDYLLQPNRFERLMGDSTVRLYIDGNVRDIFKLRPELRRIAPRKSLGVRIFETDFKFSQVQNAHSGCFFLNAAQMARWASMDYFLDRSQEFVGPLESAATLGVMRTFFVYKPARENAAFLELAHLDHRYLGKRTIKPAPSGAAASPVADKAAPG